MSEPKRMPYNIRVNESMTEYAFRMLEERDELQAENERLKSELNRAISTNDRLFEKYTKLKDQYESTPERWLKSGLSHFNMGLCTVEGFALQRLDDQGEILLEDYLGFITAEDIEG